MRAHYSARSVTSHWRLAMAVVFTALVASAASTSFWEMSSFTDFIAGKLDSVALSRDGHLTQAPELATVFNSGQPVIWSVVPGASGTLYAATGHRGRVYRIDPNGTATLIWTADRPEVFALAISSRDDVYAASSPNGKIYRIRQGQATEYFDPKARYIWSLALAPDGTLYAGTGDNGMVYRITGPGQGEPYYATGQGNVTGLMLDPQGRLLADVPAPNIAVTKAPVVNRIPDLYLTEGGTMTGRVCDHTGKVIVGAKVALKQDNKVIATTVTNQEGHFQFKDLKGGIYHPVSGNTEGVFRVWPEKSAPPSAKGHALLVMGENGARGQFGSVDPTLVLLTAGVIAAVVLSAIAVNNINEVNNKIDNNPVSP